MKRILLPALLLLASLAAPPASANPGRGVYVNGQVHRIYSGGSGGTIKHVAGAPTSATNWVFQAQGDRHDSGYPMYYEYMNGTGLAVFDDKIFYSYTSFPDGGTTSSMNAYVATFDLTQKKWTGKKTLGSVRTDVPSKGIGSGAAITVFDDKLYVFTDSATYTSADGVSWTSASRLVSDGRYQPVDAVTYYPPDAEPRILVVYGYINGKQNYWEQLHYATWNGVIGSGSDFPSSPPLFWNVWVYGHVSLTVGTMDAFLTSPAGAKTPSVQIFAECPTSSGPAMVRHAEFNIAGTGGSWTQSHTYQDGNGMGDVWTYAWYTDLCDSSYSPPHQARRQSIVLHYNNGSDKAFAGPSDFLVPPEPTHTDGDIPVRECGEWGGVSTDTGNEDDDDDAETFRKYWSLYGVVLGSPPFAVNEVEDEFAKGELSNVEYGQENGTEIQHSQEWENLCLFSAGLELRGGIAHVLEMQSQTDVSYRHALQKEEEQTSRVTTSWQALLGTNAQSTLDGEELGRFGWAIFGVPKVVVQDFRVYAYDYDLKAKAGTPLNQDVHLVEINDNSVTVMPVAFELENPGGPEDDYPGLLSGMEPFGRSTDLDFWHSRSWENAEGPWTVKFGDGSFGETRINALTFTTSANTSSSISEEEESLTATGETQEIELSEGLSLDVGTKLKGFKVDLKAGYDSSFATKVSNTTSFGSELKIDLVMKPCPTGDTAPDCVTKLTDQAYMLVPTPPVAGQETAPWLPTAYASQLPWALAWRVTNYAVHGGTESGLAAPPDRAQGVVVGGQGGTALSGETTWSRYVFRGAPLAWRDADGDSRPVPMTAEQFRPARGIRVGLNGWSWSSLGGTGTWTRLGRVWLYESRRSVKRNRVFVKLDFGQKTWDFELYDADLSGHLDANAGGIQVDLDLNGKYLLKSDLRHHVQSDWRWKGRARDRRSIELTSYEGTSDSAAQEGTVTLEGTLPEQLSAFGDMTFELNGHAVHVPLIEHEGFLRARENAGTLEYEKDGVHLSVRFGRGTWTARFERNGFHRLMAPLRGATSVRVKVGGETWGSAELAVEDYTSKLRLDG